MLPELEVGVVDEFYECDEETPGVWSVHDHSLQQNTRDLLLNVFRVGLCEKVEQHTAEVVGVVVRVAQMVGNRIEKQVATLKHTHTQLSYSHTLSHSYPRKKER